MSNLFTTVMADPGWQYRDKLRMEKTKRSSVDQYKTTMTVDEICQLYTPSRIEQEPGLPGIVDPHSRRRENRPRTTYIPGRLFNQFELADTGFLWLWATPTVLLDGSAVAVCRAWGYEPKQIGVWIKGRIEIIPPGVRGTGTDLYDAALILQIGMGHATRGVVEFFIIATRGKYTSLVKNRGQSNLILAPEEAVILESKREHSRKPDAIYDKIESVCPGPYLEAFSRSDRPGWTAYGDEAGKFTGPAADLAVVTAAPLPMHTLLIVDDGKIEEHHDVLPDDGLEGQWP